MLSVAQEGELAACDEKRIKAEESALRLERKCGSLSKELESMKRVLGSYDAEVSAMLARSRPPAGCSCAR